MPGWHARRRLDWNPEKRARVRDEIRRRLAADPRIRLAIAFGSFARGEPFGDIDVAVSIMEPWSYLDLGRLASMIEEAAGRPGVEADVISLDAASPRLRHRIAREGLLLHTQDPWLHAAFYARAIVEGSDLEAALARTGHPVGPFGP